MQTEKTKRNGLIDIYRFLFALVIMTGHSVNVGMEPPFPFAGVGIFVEFFFLLTGYFTYSQISKMKPIEIGERMQESLRYTFRKFSAFFPYLLVSVGARYIYDFCLTLKNSEGGYIQALTSLFYAPFELLLTNYMFSEIPQKVGALYFLAAMLVVLPLFCMLCMCRNNSLKLGAALYAMLFYYHDADWAITADYPKVLLRAFCGMCMGVVVYFAVNEFEHIDSFMKHSFVIWIIGNILLIASMMLSGLSLDNRRIQLLCIFIGVLALILSSMYVSLEGNAFTSYLAKLSMVIYIMHWSVGVILNGVMSNFGLTMKMIMYYAVTMVLSMAVLYLFERKQS